MRSRFSVLVDGPLSNVCMEIYPRCWPILIGTVLHKGYGSCCLELNLGNDIDALMLAVSRSVDVCWLSRLYVPCASYTMLWYGCGYVVQAGRSFEHLSAIVGAFLTPVRKILPYQPVLSAHMVDPWCLDSNSLCLYAHRRTTAYNIHWRECHKRSAAEGVALGIRF